jgi:hypothetical protein
VDHDVAAHVFANRGCHVTTSLPDACRRYDGRTIGTARRRPTHPPFRPDRSVSASLCPVYQVENKLRTRCAERLRLEIVADGPANEFAWKTLRRMNVHTLDTRIHALPSVPCEFIRRLLNKIQARPVQAAMRVCLTTDEHDAPDRLCVAGTVTAPHAEDAQLCVPTAGGGREPLTMRKHSVSSVPFVHPCFRVLLRGLRGAQYPSG